MVIREMLTYSIRRSQHMCLLKSFAEMPWRRTIGSLSPEITIWATPTRISNDVAVVFTRYSQRWKQFCAGFWTKPGVNLMSALTREHIA